MAETYFNSLQHKGINAISSGIRADLNTIGPVTWYAQRIFQNYNLVRFEKMSWTQTTRQLLATAEITVFIRRMHYEYCKKYFGFNAEQYIVWDIPDIDEQIFNEASGTMEGDIERMAAAETTFQMIRQHVDELVSSLVNKR